MKIIVAGGAGFIGSHLCERLLKEGHQVVCLDSLLTGNLKNLQSFKDHKKFQFIKTDIVKKIPPGLSDVEAIFHLASPASPKDYQKHSIQTMLVNSVGTRNLLELAKKNGAKFLITSTSEIYGDPKEHPQKETYWGNVNPVGIRSCYDESKRFAEALVMEYLRKFDVDVRIIRIFNTYGPRMQKDDGRVVPNFINQVLSGKPITIYGTGKQTRSFCYVSDMVDGLIKAVVSSKTKGEIFNLGNPKEHAIYEFAKIICNLLQSKLEIVYKPLPADDPERRKPDIVKAKKILNFEPKVNLNKGLLATVEYFKRS